MEYGCPVRRAALCCALVGALVAPQQTAAADYSTPDYYVSADVNPYTTSGPITIVYSSANLSDVSAAATVVKFFAARRSKPVNKTLLGHVAIPALGPWQTITQTVSFPLPSWLAAGTTGMRLISNINPAKGNGEVKIGNNITRSNFDAVVTATSSPLPDLTVTSLGAPASTGAGSALAISDTVRNVGSANAGGFSIGYYLDGPTGRTTLAHHTSPGLSASSSSLESFSVTVPASLPASTYTLTVQANTTGSVQESNTGNNIATQSLTLTSSSPPPPPPPVDTTLVGFGSTTPGGTGQPIYTVTSLASSGPGTLRDAVSQGYRDIKFAVAGTINLKDAIETKGPFLTIDGLSAPAPGITLKGAGLYIMGYSSEYQFDNHSHDIIVRGIRVRDPFDDAFRVAYNAYNVVFDHVSALGGGDGNIDVTEDSHDVTVSWSIFAAAVRNSLLAYRAWHISMHHNLFIGTEDRNPLMGYDYSGTPSSTLNLDFWNNLVWDWDGGSGSRIAFGSKANVVNNYYYTPNGDNEDALVVCQPQTVSFPVANQGDCNNNDPTYYARAYVNGNVEPAALGRDINRLSTEGSAFAGGGGTPQSGCAAVTSVLAGVGVRPLDGSDSAYLASVSLPAGVCP